MAGTGGKKTRIAILGGGVAALTTAFELTEHDPDGDYEIVIYTLGWRLGGKAAVGRDAARYDRAYEHGLHIWAGFYDNAFDVVKRLYARLGKDEDAWRSFFKPLNHFTVMENVEEQWKPWLIAFPPNGREPGIDSSTAFSPWPMLVQFLAMLDSAFRETDYFGRVSAGSRQRFAEELANISPLGQPSSADEIALTTTSRAARRLPSDPAELGDDRRLQLIQLIETSRLQICETLDAAPPSDAQRRLQIIFDLGFALARGLLSDDLFFGGFDAIDETEWSAWMGQNGCKPETLESAVVRGCYDYAFASRDKGIGAGTATVLILRFLLTYKGSVLHELVEPMGDFLFAPMYLYLRDVKKVKFEFFCRAKEVALSDDGLVDRVILDQQVSLAKHVNQYEPLIERRDGRPSWPSAPKAEQIEGGFCLEEGACYKNPDLESNWTDWPDANPHRVLNRRTSAHGSDETDVFDILVLALGFDGLKQICAGFSDKAPGWSDFLGNIRTAQTAALQLWLLPSTDELGWPDSQTALTGFELAGDEWSAAPMTSWEDNTGLLPLERRRACQPPRSLAYFCGVFPDNPHIPPARSDPTFPGKERDRAWNATSCWMNGRLGALWPKAVGGSPPQFKQNLLESLEPNQSIREQHYFKVNIDPSERYVLSVPGSGKYRLPPHRTGIANLYLAGDFVRSGVNAGCIEAAVIAGRMTARAITEADMAIPGESNSGLYSLPISALPLINVVDKLKSLTAGGLGTIEAYCLTVVATTEFVMSKLPDGLRLVTPANWGDKHPIMLVFSRQKNVRPGILPFGGLNYFEFLELIPNVERCDTYAPSGGPFTYMPYLLLDQPLAVTVGQNLYGFNKRIARISADEGAYVVKSDLGELRTALTGLGLPGTIDKMSSISGCRKFLGQPFIAQRPTGEWVYSYLDYRLESATYQKVVGQFDVDKTFLEKTYPDCSDAYDVDAYRNFDISWFRFTSQWRLSMPLTAGTMSDTAAPGQINSIVSQWTGRGLAQFFNR